MRGREMPTGYDGEKYTDTDVVTLRAALGLTDTAKPKKDAVIKHHVAQQQETQPKGGGNEKKFLIL